VLSKNFCFNELKAIAEVKNQACRKSKKNSFQIPLFSDDGVTNGKNSETNAYEDRGASIFPAKRWSVRDVLRIAGENCNEQCNHAKNDVTS